MHPASDGVRVVLLSCLVWGAPATARGEEARDRDVRLEMWPIWTARADRPWLYVEQAAAGQRNRPYRQRVHRLINRGDGTFKSRVYTLPGPARFVGACKEEVGLSRLAPASLPAREGCSIILHRVDHGVFVGSTHARDWPSELRAALYAASEVRNDVHGMTSWDRRFDTEGHQVWGAVKGGYDFERVEL